MFLFLCVVTIRLINSINQEIYCQILQEFGSFSVAEGIILYAGRHYAQMYTRRKRIKCGFKLCAHDVRIRLYVCKLKVYLRKEKKSEYVPLEQELF